MTLGVGCGSLTTVPASQGSSQPPWQLAEEEYPSQRLLRLKFDDGSGGGSFRLALRLAAPDRYQARAVDLFGRPLWSAEVEPAAGTVVDHRQRRWCAIAGRAEGLRLPLAPFPMTALPALLVGRLPAQGEVRRLAEEGRFEVTGVDGLRWTGRERSGELVSWTLWREGDRRLSWVRQGGEAILSDPAGGFQLRWRSGTRHELPLPLTAMRLPEGYEEVPCRLLLDRLSPI